MEVEPAATASRPTPDEADDDEVGAEAVDVEGGSGR